MPKDVILTLARLNKEKDIVLRELHKLSLCDEKLEDVDVYLVPLAPEDALGYCEEDDGIHMPMVNIGRLKTLLGGSQVSFRDVLRHEYGHAFANTHRGLIRSKAFTETFGQPYTRWDIEQKYDPEVHVSEYAATKSAEDFAETFMYYVKHKGVIPKRWSGLPIHSKWLYIADLATAIRDGRSRM